jgi:hypothetical protein
MKFSLLVMDVITTLILSYQLCMITQAVITSHIRYKLSPSRVPNNVPKKQQHTKYPVHILPTSPLSFCKPLIFLRECIFWAPPHLHPHIWVVNWCIKIRADLFFALSNNFSFLYLSLYITFESETWQFTEAFDIDFGKNSSRFLWQYIFTF